MKGDVPSSECRDGNRDNSRVKVKIYGRTKFGLQLAGLREAAAGLEWSQVQHLLRAERYPGTRLKHGGGASTRVVAQRKAGGHNW